MESLVINGGKKLYGSVRIESAKNSVLTLLAGSLLTDEEVVIHNCPKIQDVLSMIKILEYLGAKIKFVNEDLLIKCDQIIKDEIPNELSKELRASVLILGALLGRRKRAKISYPGGCNIGIRPIDIHINSFKKLGAEIKDVEGNVECNGKKMKGGSVYFDFPSVGATENVILAMAISEGTTYVHNPAKEPEIVDLCKFLNKMGARITGAGSTCIIIDGVKKLGGVEYKPIPDRIEAGTYLVASAICGGEIEIINVNQENISSLLGKICDNTCKIWGINDIINVKSGEVRKGFSVSTGPYPFFPTDMQAQITSLLAVSTGISVVEENVFEMRFRHIPELVKMGADIKVRGRTAIIKGVKKLYGTNVTCHDLRCGASLVLAGLCAEGQTTINDISHLKRGYLDIDKKLSNLGADIKIIK